ncbi:MAG: tetratricopeptide repeat protein, partial [Calditrichaeota bacterium]
TLYNTYCDLHTKSDPNFNKFALLQKKLINKAISLNPKLSALYSIKAEIDRWFGNKKEYLDDIVYAYQLDSTRVENIFMMGRLYHSINLFGKAIQKFDRAISRDPIYAFYYAKRAWTYYRMGELAKAESDFLKALTIDSTSIIANWEYFIFLLSTKRVDEAEIISSRLLKLTPLYSDAVKAVMAAARGKKEMALSYTKIPRQQKMNVYLLLKMKEEALALLEKNPSVFVWDSICFYKILIRDPLFAFLRSDPRFQKIVENQRKLYDYYVHKYGDV